MASCHEVLPPVVVHDNNNSVPTSKCRISYIHADPILTFLNNLHGAKCQGSGGEGDDTTIPTDSDEPEQKAYKCPCGRQFKRKVHFQRHMDLAHSQSQQQSYKCNECAKTFGNLSQLTMHMSVHGHNKQSSLASLAQDSAGPEPSATTSSSSPPPPPPREVRDSARSKRVTRSSRAAKSKSPARHSSDKAKTAATMATGAETEQTYVAQNVDNNVDFSLLLNNNVPKLVTLDSGVTLNEHLPQVMSTVEVSSEPMDTAKEESDKENFQQTVSVSAEESMQTVSSSSQHVLIKVQKGTMFAPSGGVTTGAGTQMVTIPLVMSNLSSAVMSSGSGSRQQQQQQMTQVYTYPASAAPVLLPQPMMPVEHVSTEAPANDPDDAKVRKSARLTGKVPGWKALLQEEQQTPSAELRPRKRRRDEAEEDEVAMAVQSIGTEQPDDGSKRNRISKEDFPCEICGKSFTSEKYLSMHRALHNVQNPAEDMMAGELKVEPEGYIKNGNTWTCKICSKVFAQNSSFKNHMRTHSDERPYVCEVCSIGFKERYHLKKHQLFKHTTELKEECRVCKKRFKDSTAVRAHERIHSTERPYKCRNCQKAFKTSECLWHHENRSKACGSVANTMPPEKRRRAKNAARKQQESESEIDVKPTVMMVNVPQSVHTPLPPTQSNQPTGVSHPPPPPAHLTPSAQPVHADIKRENMDDMDLMNEVINADINAFNDEPILNDDGELLIPGEDLSAPISDVSGYPMVVTTQPTFPTSLPGSTSSPMLLTGSIPVAAPVNQAALQAYSSMPMQMCQPASAMAVPQSVTSSVNVTEPKTGGIANTVRQNVAPLPSVGEMLSRPVIAKPVNEAVTQQQQQATSASQLIYQQPAPVIQAVSRPVSRSEPVYVTTPIIQQLTSKQYVTFNKAMSSPTTQALIQQPSCQPQPHLLNHASTAAVNLPIHGASAQKSAAVILNSSQPGNLPTPRPIPSATVDTAATASAKPIAAVQPWLTTKRDIKKEPSHAIQSTWKPETKMTRGKMSNFVCSKCGKGFAAKSAFQKHLVRHDETEDKPYRCESCKMGFKLKVHLKKHNLYRHSSEYPCKCSICGKKFKDSSAVRLHERIHSDKRPFFCDCGKGFKTRENLWGHQRRKTKKNNMCPMARKCNDVNESRHVLGSMMAEETIITTNGEMTTTDLGAEHVTSNTFTVKVEMPHQYTNQPSLFQPSAPNVFPTSSSPCSTAPSPTSSTSSLPPFETFTSGMRGPGSPGYSMPLIVKKESLADKCPTIQNLLKKGPTPSKRLPGIQQLFQGHLKPPPPYPGTFNKVLPTSSSRYAVPRTPQSPAPNQLMINPDQMYESSRGPYLRTPPPPAPALCTKDRLGSTPSASPHSDLSSRCSNDPPHTPGTPGSQSSSGTSEATLIWEDEAGGERKPVVTQWQNQDSETLFYELSSHVLNHME